MAGGQAVAFLGLSRSGKTTLAGAYARAGHPFMSEDVVELTLVDGQYWLQPSRPVLRLFHDSASFLLGEAPEWAAGDGKNELDARQSLPFTDLPAPLALICLLGPGASDCVTLEPINTAAALTQLMRHAFVLDVEDREILRGHFTRLSELALHTPCAALDYPRTYDQLPNVIDAVLGRVTRGA